MLMFPCRRSMLAALHHFQQFGKIRYLAVSGKDGYGLLHHSDVLYIYMQRLKTTSKVRNLKSLRHFYLFFFFLLIM